MTAAERRWCWTRAALVMALTLVPYLWAWRHTPPGHVFSWVLYGRDDHMVYMAWMRQVADGHFFLRNLFTTDPQSGRLSNLFFFLLGQPVRCLGVSPALMLHLARLGFGALLLVLIYCFATFFTESVAARRATFWLAALSAGFGWGAHFGWYAGDGVPPVDLWQPEALTGLSIYTTALFAAATCAIVGIFCLLLAAERTGQRRYASWAGVLALLLGNFHSYDILHVAAAWGLYLLGKTALGLVRGEGIPRRSWGDAAACGVIGLPSVVWQYLVYRADPVFHQRADYATLSPPFSAYVLGYGLVLLLALAGGVLLLRGQPGSPLKLAQRWMPIAWAIAGFGVAYLPLAFNRKMIMGTHVPFCLLAGIAVAALAEGVFRCSGVQVFRRSGNRRNSPQHPSTRTPEHLNTLLVALVVLLTAPTSVCFALRDLAMAGDRPWDLNWFSAYWPEPDVRAATWVREHTPRDAAFFCTAVSGRYVAGVGGRATYVGHWGETPRFNERVAAAVDFFQSAHTPEERLLQLKSCGTSYVFQGTNVRRAGAVDLSRDPDLEKVYDSGGVSIYRARG
jgi:hypothetical protein